MVLHVRSASPFAEPPTEAEMRSVGITDDQIGELRGKVQARTRSDRRVSLAGDKRLADVLREVDTYPTAADWVGKMAEAECKAVVDTSPPPAGYDIGLQALRLGSELERTKDELGLLQRARSGSRWAVFALCLASFSSGFTFCHLLHVHFGGGAP